jgi:hypothetical protein
MLSGAAAVLLGLLAACATAPGPAWEGELARVSRQCREQGGILIPFGGGATTGRVETDFACQISGPPSRTRDPAR